MTLLEEIQSAAVDSNHDLGTLLRKCKLLAARLGSKPLEDWLVWESNGYPNDVTIPEYRMWRLEIKGHFLGPFGSELRNVPISLAFLPEKERDQYRSYECRESIANIEVILAKAKGGKAQVNTGDLALILGTNVIENMDCIQTWAEFGTGHLVGLLNAVRNRILDFALALWKEEPMAGEPGTKTSNGTESMLVTQIFNTTIYGGSVNVVGTAKDSTLSFNVTTGDFTSLERVLRENRVSENDIKELKTAIESEEKPTTNSGFGPKVSSWISKMKKKAAEGSWEISLNAAGTLLGQLIAKYYGL